MIDAPVQIGQVVYRARAWSYGDKRVPCPVCFGQMFVTLILGNGEHVKVECDGCGLGFNGPQGFVNAPCPGSSVTPLSVAGFVQDGRGWEIIDTNNSRHRWGEEAFATEAEAEARRAALFAEALRDAAEAGERQARHKRKGLTWKVRYHRDCIKRAERELAYHSRKLSDDLARQRKPTSGEVAA